MGSLRLLLQVLARLPMSFAQGIGRFLAALWALIQWLLGLRRRRPRKRPTDCFPIPPDVARRPDPCLYAQWYLAAKGFSVTWNNPDIQIVTPAGVPVDSQDLQPDTDYRVQATIHNASFDAALGVEVICVYKPWSFGSPERVPVEADPVGNPAVRHLNIGPWPDTAVASFTWHTPNVADAHFCIQVECRHPDDREPNNNLGQENTRTARPASPVDIQVPLFNPRSTSQRILIMADSYEIPAGDIEFRLAELKARPPEAPDQGGGSVPIERRLSELFPVHPSEGARIRLRITDDAGRRRARPATARGRKYRVYGYPQRESLRVGNALGSFPLPIGWSLDVAGAQADETGWRITAAPADQLTIGVSVTTAPGAKDRQPLNLNAYFEDGFLLGGVTVLVEE